MSNELSLFFGRFHPVLVHLPIGLLLLLAFLEVLAKWPRFQYATSNAGLILALAAPLSALAALLGWFLSKDGYDPKLLQWHMWTGIGTASAAVMAALLHAAGLKRLYRVVLFVAVGALAVASHLGGSLTHGSDYLTRYAPAPLRDLLDWRTTTPQPTPAPPKEPPLEEPLFTKHIAPILEDRCAACHGPEKAKGGLRLDSFQALMAGGDSGPGILAANSDGSEILKRIHLPIDHDDHMPPDGKPQPSEEEITLLRWWVDSGASPTKGPSELGPPPHIAKFLKLPTAQNTTIPAGSKPPLLTPLPRSLVRPAVELLMRESGLPIAFLGETNDWLQVNASIEGKAFGDEQLAKVAHAVGTNVAWLELSGTGITDEGLRHLAGLPGLKRLYLSRTSISDAGLAHLGSLRELEYLNLYGTQVSSAGLEHLKPLPRLRQLYLWQTQVTEAQAAAFATAKMDEAQIKEWKRQIEELTAMIRDQQVTVDVGASHPAKTNMPVGSAAASLEPSRPINVICPVSGEAVDPSQTLTHDGQVVGFCCEKCKARFGSNPKEYLSKIIKKSE